MAAARTVFVHCGLHKTGSTALQRALSQNARQLEAAGLYLPPLGPRRGAHHSMAYAMKSPRAFKSNAGRFETFQAFCDLHPDSNIAISSEDFETVLTKPRALARLNRVIGAAGAETVLVIYLRHQVSYLESLYLQLLRMGLSRPMSEVLDEVLETGQLAWRKWVFQFDFARVAATAKARGVPVIFRNFHAMQRNPLADFLAVTGTDMPDDLRAARNANTARIEGNLKRFLNNALGERAPAASALMLARLEELLSGVKPRLSDSSAARLIDRFAPGNAALAAEVGFDLNAHAPDLIGLDVAPLMDAVFSAETLQAVDRVDDAVPLDAVCDQLTVGWFDENAHAAA